MIFVAKSSKEIVVKEYGKRTSCGLINMSSKFRVSLSTNGFYKEGNYYFKWKIQTSMF